MPNLIEIWVKGPWDISAALLLGDFLTHVTVNEGLEICHLIPVTSSLSLS